RRPLVALKAGMSLDGRIGTGTGLDRGITGAVSAEFGQRLRLEMDAILVGVNTILADNPRLTYRGASPRRRPLCRVILDSRLRTPPTARVLQGAPDVPLLVFCAAEARAARRLRLEGQGAEVVAVPRRGTGLSLRRVLAELGKRSLLGVLVEGGGEVHWRFVRERLADKFYFLIAPIILGGRKSIPCVGGTGYARIARAPRWAVTGNRKLGEDLLVEAYPRVSRSILSPWRS
ncbi:MAG: dihydrofolate reductase family protein, partial [Acidobacteriota bacterium]